MSFSHIYTKIYTIYLITCLINNYKYVGFTSQDPPELRRQEHIDKSNSNLKVFYPLHRAIKKYGIENFTFEILYQSKNGNDCLNYWENYFILKYESHVSTGKGYNLTFGGEGILGYKHTEESIKKIRSSNLGKICSEEKKQKLRVANLGKPCPETAKIKISIANKGKTISEQQKQNLSHDRMGSGNPMYGKSSWGKDPIKDAIRKQKLSATLTGRKFSEERKKSISERQKGRILSEKHKQNIGIANKGKPTWIKGKKWSKEAIEKRSATVRKNHAEKKAKKIAAQATSSGISSSGSISDAA